MQSVDSTFGMINGLSFGLSQRLVGNLSRASRDVGQSLERLSSGRRILGPEDGAADYNMIVKLATQVRGIQQSILNVNETQGLTTTADGALASMLSIAYNLRELAQKAADSSLSSSERTALQTEVTGLLEEFSGIANGTEYNSTSLLDGDFSSTIQVGPNYGDSFNFSIGDARSITLGRLAIYSGAQGAITTAVGGSSTSVSLNGVYITGSNTDNVSSSGSTYSAIAIVNAINAQSNDTNVKAEALATKRTLTITSTMFSNVSGFSGTIVSTDFLINGVAIATVAVSTSTGLVNKINGKTSSTGVIATLDSSGNIVLTAADGRNIQVQISNSSGNGLFKVFNSSANASLFTNPSSTLSVGANQTFVGAIRIWSSEAITIGGTTPSVSLGIASGTQSLTSGTAAEFISVTSTANANEAIKVLDATIAQISTLRANVGAVHNRLDASASYLLNDLNAKQEAKSAIGDVDMVMEMTRLVTAQLLQNASLASLTQANVSRATVAKLLGNL